MRRFGALAILFYAVGAWAQFTTVTGTVTDPNGLPYANGTISSYIVSSSTPVFSSNSQPYIQPSQAAGLNASGAFTLRLADNTQLSPGSSTWTFVVCSASGTVMPSFGKGPICFTVTGVTVSGSSQDIGATLRAAAPALTVTFGGSGSPCNTTNTSLQYDNSGAFGCTDFLFATGAPLNSYSTPSQVSIGSASLFSTSAVSLNPQLAVNLSPQFSGASGANLIGQTITLTDNTNVAGATVSGLAGLQIQANGSISNTGQSAAIPNVYGLTSTAKAPFVANVTNLRAGFFQTTSGSGTATVSNDRGVESLSVVNGGTFTNSSGLYVRSPTIGVGGTVTHRYGLYVEDQTIGSGTNSDPHGIYVAGGGIQTAVHAFSTLPACGAGQEGRMEAISDSTTNVWGATITGSGANHVLGYCDGTNWTVAAK